MSTQPIGVCGSNVSWPRTVVSSLPVIGFIMSYVNMPHIWGFCCCRGQDPVVPLRERISKIKTEHDEQSQKLIQPLEERERELRQRASFSYVFCITETELKGEDEQYQKDVKLYKDEYNIVEQKLDKLWEDCRSKINDVLADIKTTIKPVLLYSVTGVISSLLTLTGLICLVALGILTSLAIFVPAVFCGLFAMVHTVSIISHYQALKTDSI